MLQDGHLVPLLPKGASIFLSMTLQRLLRRWEKKARMASMPVQAGLLKHSNKCFCIKTRSLLCALAFSWPAMQLYILVTLYANVVLGDFCRLRTTEDSLLQLSRRLEMYGAGLRPSKQTSG